MKIGYPCINRSLPCQGNQRFRLASYSPERLVQTVENNLACLAQMLAYNVEHGFMFFRISSDLVPFASHPICEFPWARHFRDTFAALGRTMRQQDMRLSMHPDQFTLLNSPDERILNNSIKELEYHARVFELLGLGAEAKMQIHLGGVYGDKTASLARFVARYPALSPAVRRHLVIEHDDRLYSAQDALWIHGETGVPVLFDALHHRLLNNGETTGEALAACAKTWTNQDGLAMVDYSSQQPAGRAGKHAESIDPDDFMQFLTATRGVDFDVMLEIKDKEKSAAIAVRLAAQDPRLKLTGPRDALRRE